MLPNWAIILMLALIVAFNFSASYCGFSLLGKIVALAIIPVLMVNYFLRQRAMANMFFAIFILYFLGLLFNVLDYLSLSSKLSEFCFLGVYAILAFVMIGKLKYVRIEGLVSIYLVVILLTSSYFMYIMFSMVKDSFTDSVIMTLSIGKTMALLLMSLLAFAIYLSKETSQTILFLTIVCCFVFSDVLSFITTMYVQYWLFDGIQKILQGAGLLLFCFYVYNHQEMTSSFRKFTSKTISRSKHIPIRY